MIRRTPNPVDLGWTLDNNEGWRDEAACREHPAETWFPEQSAAAQGQEAKRICRGCPVIAECAAYAVAHRELDGIWGGLTAKERQLARRRAA